MRKKIISLFICTISLLTGCTKNKYQFCDGGMKTDYLILDQVYPSFWNGFTYEAPLEFDPNGTWEYDIMTLYLSLPNNIEKVINAEILLRVENSFGYDIYSESQITEDFLNGKYHFSAEEDQNFSCWQPLSGISFRTRLPVSFFKEDAKIIINFILRYADTNDYFDKPIYSEEKIKYKDGMALRSGFSQFKYIK